MFLLCQSSDAGTLVGAYKSKFSSELLHIIGISSQLDDFVDACRRSDGFVGLISAELAAPARRGATRGENGRSMPTVLFNMQSSGRLLQWIMLYV